jgi:hypothetical protein
MQYMEYTISSGSVLLLLWREFHYFGKCTMNNQTEENGQPVNGKHVKTPSAEEVHDILLNLETSANDNPTNVGEQMENPAKKDEDEDTAVLALVDISNRSFFATEKTAKGSQKAALAASRLETKKLKLALSLQEAATKEYAEQLKVVQNSVTALRTSALEHADQLSVTAKLRKTLLKKTDELSLQKSLTAGAEASLIKEKAACKAVQAACTAEKQRVKDVHEACALSMASHVSTKNRLLGELKQAQSESLSNKKDFVVQFKLAKKLGVSVEDVNAKLKQLEEKYADLENKLKSKTVLCVELKKTSKKDLDTLKAKLISLNKKLDTQLAGKQQHELQIKEIALQQDKTKFETYKLQVNLETVKIAAKSAEHEQKVASAKTIISHRAVTQKKLTKARIILKEDQRNQAEAISRQRIAQFASSNAPQAQYLTPQQAHRTTPNGGTFPVDQQGAAAFGRGAAAHFYQAKPPFCSNILPCNMMASFGDKASASGSKRKAKLEMKKAPPPSSFASQNARRPLLVQGSLTHVWGTNESDMSESELSELEEQQVEVVTPDNVASQQQQQEQEYIARQQAYCDADGVIEILSSDDSE